MNETLLIAMISAAAGLVGAIIGSVSSAVGAYIISKAENVRHTRELGLKVAMANFEMATKTAQKLADLTGREAFIPPIKAWIVQGMKVMDAISNPRLSREELIRQIDAAEDLAQAVARAAQQKN